MRFNTALILACGLPSCWSSAAESVSANGASTTVSSNETAAPDEADGADVISESAEFEAERETPGGIRIAAPEVLASDGRITVETRRYELGDRAGFAWHVRVDRQSALVSVAAETSPVAFADLLPSEEESAWAAINGGFYDRSQAPMGLAVVDGTTVTPITRGGGSGVFEVVDDELRIVHRDAADAGARYALQSIDRIANEGRSLVGSGASPQLAARSALALTPSELVFVVLADELSIDGDDLSQVQLRTTSGHGVSLASFAEYVLATTQASEVLNLDGSVSTQLAANVAGQSIRVRGVRGTPNAVLVR